MGEDAWKTEKVENDLMARAVALSLKAEGFTAPNPVVGCVIAADGEIIGEGYHRGPGTPHAEVDALNAAGAAANGASAYVTLEPCNHHGATPPCVDALIKAGVAEVIYAVADPNPIASGGARRLEKAGIKTRQGIGHDLASEANRFWLHRITHGRPFVIAKFAMSLDGKIATHSGESQWITGPKSREQGHRLRQLSDVIIVGAGTIEVDDPSLTVRYNIDTPAHPLRVVLDSKGRTSPHARVYEQIGAGAVLVCTDEAPPSRLDEFRTNGIEPLILEKNDAKRPDLHALLSSLAARGVNSIMIEGGAETLGSFFDARLVDEVWAFIAPVVIGGDGKMPVGGTGAATIPQALRLHDVTTKRLGDDLFMRGKAKGRTA